MPFASPSRTVIADVASSGATKEVFWGYGGRKVWLMPLEEAMNMMKRATVVCTVSAATLAFGALPAMAASNPASSCIGTIVSTLAPAGSFNVQVFKDIAVADGHSRFGTFVAEGAHSPRGNLVNCLPD